MFVSNITEALKKIDFQIVDDDAIGFQTYVFKNHYKIDLPYEYPEYRPPKYFRILYKEIFPFL